MEVGKWYKLKDSRIAEYIEANPRCNENMIKLLAINGGAFSPTKIKHFCDEYFVEEAITLNFKILTCEKEGEDYFEICGDEFKFFEEVCKDTLSPFKEYGVVNSENAEEIIRRIAKDFLNKEVKLC